MKIDAINRSIFTIILPVSVLLCFFIFSKWQMLHKIFFPLKDSLKWHKTVIVNKQKGAHVFGIKDSTNFQPFLKNNLEWITLVSWGSQDNYDSPDMKHQYRDSLQMLQYDSSWVKRIKLVRAAGFKVFLKPHIWISNPSKGTWRSEIFPTNQDNWKLWKESYRDFILRYAKIAELGNAEMFCIGTEFSRLTTEKPLFWKNLIQEVRGIYTGKITYAANWYNEYEKITFWKDLDYIGIQAYFPLVKNEYPSVEQISKGWKKFLPSIKAIHKKYNRKILFTELRYKSTPDSAIEPWQWIQHSSNEKQPISMETQVNCYEAFFKTVWKKKWFAGVHIWQLRSDYVKGRGKNELDFTPQGKPAENVIAKGFK